LVLFLDPPPRLLNFPFEKQKVLVDLNIMPISTLLPAPIKLAPPNEVSTQKLMLKFELGLKLAEKIGELILPITE
jgi:hypothetical protein